MTSSIRCPCGSGNLYPDCCGPRHDGEAPAPTAIALMRSRYCAFALGRAGYLLDTWHPSTRPDQLELDDRIRWTRLEILGSVQGGPFDATGVVEFRAHYRRADAREQLHERSVFTRHDGRWFYVSFTPLT
jgi:SEC-C motif-containing protein